MKDLYIKQRREWLKSQSTRPMNFAEILFSAAVMVVFCYMVANVLLEILTR